MTDKELRRMGRQELLNELYQFAKENSELRLRVENIEEEFRQYRKKYEDAMAEEEKKQLFFKNKLKAEERRNKELSERLRKRNVVLEDAGNIADATLKITNIFEEAQKTADLYVKNVQDMAARQEYVLKEMEEKSRKDIQEMGDQASRTCIAMRDQTEKDCADMRKQAEHDCAVKRTQTERECVSMRAKTEVDCQMMKREALEQAESYWNNLTERLENFYDAHKGMRELFGSDFVRIPSFQNLKKDN